MELGPAVVAVDPAVVALGGNGSTNGETGGDACGAKQSNVVGMEVCAISRAGIASILGVALSPAGPVLHVSHSVYRVIVQRSCADEIPILAGKDFGGEGSKLVGFRNKSFRCKEVTGP